MNPFHYYSPMYSTKVFWGTEFSHALPLNTSSPGGRCLVRVLCVCFPSLSFFGVPDWMKLFAYVRERSRDHLAGGSPGGVRRPVLRRPR